MERFIDNHSPVSTEVQTLKHTTTTDEQRFIVPLDQTSQISQEMRDSQALLKLKNLENGIAQKRAQRMREIFKLAPMFKNAHVSSFIRDHKDNLSNINELLTTAKISSEGLSTQQIEQIDYASSLFGNIVQGDVEQNHDRAQKLKVELSNYSDITDDLVRDIQPQDLPTHLQQSQRLISVVSKTNPNFKNKVEQTTCEFVGTISGKKCNFCRAPQSITKKHSQCSACKKVFYCSADCQKYDWQKKHRAECKDLWIKK